MSLLESQLIGRWAEIRGKGRERLVGIVIRYSTIRLQPVGR